VDKADLKSECLLQNNHFRYNIISLLIDFAEIEMIMKKSE